MTLEIGTKVHVDGYDGVVVSNSLKSFYGHCPESMVLVRMPGGIALKEIHYCKVVSSATSPRTGSHGAPTSPSKERPVEYTIADTIAIRLAESDPLHESDSRDDLGMGTLACVHCHASRRFGDPSNHAPDCLFLFARQYKALLDKIEAAEDRAAEKSSREARDEANA